MGILGPLHRGKPTRPLSHEESPVALPPIVIIDLPERNHKHTQKLPRLDIPRERALMVVEPHQRGKRRPWWKFWCGKRRPWWKFW